MLFNRQFSKGHLLHASTEERMNHYRPNHMGVQIGEVLSYRNGKVTVKLSKDLYQHDGLRILNEPVDTGLTAVRIEKQCKLVGSAKKGDIVQLDCKAKPHPKPGQPLMKTTDTPLQETLRKEIERQPKVPIKVSYSCFENKPLTITLQKDEKSYSYTSSSILESAKNAPLSKDRLEEAINKTGDTIFEIVSMDGEIGNVFIPISMLNQCRREAFDAFYQILSCHYPSRKEENGTCNLEARENPFGPILMEYHHEKPYVLDIHTDKEERLEILSYYNENGYNNYRIQKSVISEIGGLWDVKGPVITAMNFNVTNHYALAFLYQNPAVSGIVLSSELNELMLEAMVNKFQTEYGFLPNVYQLVYGRRVLMSIKNGFGEAPNETHITDLHGHRFPILHRDNVTELLEAEPIHRKGIPQIGDYLIITDEDEFQIQNIREEANEEICGRI